MLYIPHSDVVSTSDMNSVRLKNECMKALENLVCQVSQFSLCLNLPYIPQYQSRDPQVYESVRNHWQKLFFTVEEITQAAPEHNHSTQRPSPVQVCSVFPSFYGHLYPANTVTYLNLIDHPRATGPTFFHTDVSLVPQISVEEKPKRVA